MKEKSFNFYTFDTFSKRRKRFIFPFVSENWGEMEKKNQISSFLSFLKKGKCVKSLTAFLFLGINSKRKTNINKKIHLFNFDIKQSLNDVEKLSKKKLHNNF